MSQYTIDRFAGLYNGPNEISAVPKGALRSAKNCVIRNRGVIEPRRGFSADASLPTKTLKNFFFHGGERLFLAYDSSTLQYTLSSAAGDYPAANAPTPPDSAAYGSRGLSYGGRFYLTTNSGVQVLDSTAAGTALQYAGAPRGAGFRFLSLTSGGAAGVLPLGKTFAYVNVWGVRDANGRVILGAPSGREIITNTIGGSLNVTFKVAIPYGAGTQHFCRIYRTEAVTSPTPPGAEYYLVDEISGITATDIANGYLAPRIDDTPDVALQDVAYFSDSQGGLLGANDTPPKCLDMCLFADRVLYAHTRQRHSVTVTLLGVDPTGAGSGGVQIGDTIVVNDPGGTPLLTLTGDTGEVLPTFKFLVSANSDPALAVEETCQSIARVINSAPGSPLGAYYTPNPIGFGGNVTIFLETLAPSPAYFYLTAPTRGDAYNPPLPTSGESVKSSDDYAKNRVYWSRIGQPDAVPLVNYVDVGSSEAAIHRIITLRDKVYVFKDDGIFTLSGSAPYRVDEMDATVKLVAPQSAVKVSNQIYALTNQGVVSVSEGGAQIVSGPIDNDLPGPSSDNSAYAAGAGYESEHLYFLFFRDGSSYPVRVYSTTEGVWTTWDADWLCADVDPYADKLTAAETSGTGARILVERKNYLRGDYADPEFSRTTVSGSAVEYLALSDVSGISAGDYFRADVGSFEGWVSRVDALTGRAYVALLTPGVPQTVPAAGVSVTFFPGYECEAVLAATHLGAPTVQKQASEATYHFRKCAVLAPVATFSTDLTPDEKTQTLQFSHRPNGPDANGSSPKAASLPTNKLVLVPGSHQRASYYSVGFRIREALSVWSLNGISLNVQSGTEKNTR